MRLATLCLAKLGYQFDTFVSEVWPSFHNWISGFFIFSSDILMTFSLPSRDDSVVVQGVIIVFLSFLFNSRSSLLAPSAIALLPVITTQKNDPGSFSGCCWPLSDNSNGSFSRIQYL